MSPKCRIVKATPGDLRHVGVNMRQEHIAEIRAQSVMTPLDAVVASARDSGHVFAGRVGETPLFVCGTERKRVLSDAGSVWMFATPEIDAYPLEAAEALRRLFHQAHRLAGVAVLEQFIPSWYAKGIKWLLWLGWRSVGTRMIHDTPHVHMIHEEDAEWA